MTNQEFNFTLESFEVAIRLQELAINSEQRDLKTLDRYRNRVAELRLELREAFRAAND